LPGKAIFHIEMDQKFGYLIDEDNQKADAKELQM
jgi:hypothetical protein